MVRWPESANWIILVRLCWMEIVDEDQVTLFVYYHFVALIVQGHILVRLDHGAKENLGSVHLLIKIVKLWVSEIFIVHEIPLSSAVLITISVSFTREIDPLRVSKLVAHEVEIALTAERLRNETDHFVDGHSSGNLRRAL